MKDDILRAELIGKTITIIDSTNAKNKGIHGKIIDETKNMITIQTTNGTKKLIKNTITLEMKHQNKTYQINGKLLINKPEERIKKVRAL